MRKNMFKVMALSLAMATLSTTAAFAAGWGKVGSEWYYYQEDGSVARNTWVNTLVSNDESGELSYQVGNKDFVTEEGKSITASYWVQGNGVMAASAWVADGDAWYRVDAKGLIMKDQVYNENKDMYYLGKDGRMVTNSWYQNEEGKWYYFAENGKAVKNGWKTIDDAEYYFLKSGTMATDVNIPGGGHVGADGKRDR